MFLFFHLLSQRHPYLSLKSLLILLILLYSKLFHPTLSFQKLVSQYYLLARLAISLSN
ncbi:unnamed protein product [Meloidogyne enterolobii]|uniref:Uncharacterized protein n=1 Tax=Meloidogyne enterolobii TaxID=390850 RepID=A0ACB1AHK0_MELEN